MNLNVTIGVKRMSASETCSIHFPGQWITLQSAEYPLAQEMRGPHKIILKKSTPSPVDCEIMYLMSQDKTLSEYRSSPPQLGAKLIPGHVSVIVLDDSNAQKLESTKEIRESARQFLKALVQFREHWEGFDPETGGIATSETLKEKLSSPRGDR
jgi:hypothetical protein